MGIKKEKRIPTRYIISALLTVGEAFLIAVMITLAYAYFSLARPFIWAFIIFSAIRVAGADAQAEYKIPWLIFIFIIPPLGSVSYFLFYSEHLSKKKARKLARLSANSVKKDDFKEFCSISEERPTPPGMARMLTELGKSHLYKGSEIVYFSSGSDMMAALTEDMDGARKFIFLEYYIVEEGHFFDTVRNILIKKASEGVEVRLIYDEIGCLKKAGMEKLKALSKYGIKVSSFAPPRPFRCSDFNNRSHRKIAVIDGEKAYTGGINIADEYINLKSDFGSWRDSGIRIKGGGVDEFTYLFLADYSLSKKGDIERFDKYYRYYDSKGSSGYIIPFGDGPSPIYEKRIAKNAILAMLAGAEKYVYITSPYLVIDGDIYAAIENAALRGVDIKIMTPHIFDSKLISIMTRQCYERLLRAGVRIFEYAPGFLHAKTYIADGIYAIAGSMNLDYRSLAHNYENGVWFYAHPVISDMEKDIESILSESKEIKLPLKEKGISHKILNAVIKLISPLF